MTNNPQEIYPIKSVEIDEVPAVVARVGELIHDVIAVLPEREYSEFSRNTKFTPYKEPESLHGGAYAALYSDDSYEARAVKEPGGFVYIARYGENKRNHSALKMLNGVLSLSTAKYDSNRGKMIENEYNFKNLEDREAIYKELDRINTELAGYLQDFKESGYDRITPEDENKAEQGGGVLTRVLTVDTVEERSITESTKQRAEKTFSDQIDQLVEENAGNPNVLPSPQKPEKKPIPKRFLRLFNKKKSK